MKLIICALKSEIESTLKFLQPAKIDFIINIELYKKDNWLFAISKIGQVNATLTLTAIIIKYEIKEIYNFGTAGTMKNNFNILDIVYAKNTKYLFVDVSTFGYEMGQIPGENANFTSSSLLINKVKNKFKLPIKAANLGTSDIFIDKKEYWDFVIKKYNNKIDSIDMEAASLFQVANRFSIPIISIKIISDFIVFPKTSKNEFQKNLKKISNLIKNLILYLLHN